MNRKLPFSREFAYILGLFITALGVSFMEKPDFGVSMVVAPAYILHLKISQTYSFFTFGMAEYTLQAVVLIIMIIVLFFSKGIMGEKEFSWARLRSLFQRKSRKKKAALADGEVSVDE